LAKATKHFFADSFGRARIMWESEDNGGNAVVRAPAKTTKTAEVSEFIEVGS
jgi:hypothetical protein